MRPARVIARIGAASVLFAAVLGTASPAAAASIAVTTTEDEFNSDGDCALREAIHAANTNTSVDACGTGSPGVDVITLPAGTYTMAIPPGPPGDDTTGSFKIGDQLTVNGAGAATTIVDGANLDRVFGVLGNVTFSLNDVTVRNGSASDGAAINSVSANVTLTNDVITQNTGSNGAGVFNFQGTLTVASSTISSNNGNGISNAGGSVTVTNSTVSGNAGSSCCGGGIISNVGDLTVTNSTISGNSADHGAGIFASSPTTIMGSTISNNTATNEGGGVAVVGNPLVSIDGTTISGNSAADGAGFSNDGLLEITDSTISGNTASSSGGAMVNFGQATLDNADVQTNSAPNTGGLLNANGGQLTVRNGSTISGNTSTASCCGAAGGGGVTNDDHAVFDMDASTIDGNSTDSGGGLNTEGIATITNSTISNNTATGFAGGGISNGGKLTVDGSTIDGNSADTGGGIQNGDGAVTITDTAITGNTGDGGGVAQFGPGVTNIQDSMISGNTAPNGGGGVRLNVGGTVNILRTEISGNTATSGGGGGIHNGPDNTSNTVNLTDSTISGNSADEGGGLFNGVVTTIKNSTFSGNSSATGGAGVATVEPDALTTIRSSTITNSVGPGLGNEGVTSIKNTIAANSSGGSDCDGTITSAGYNLIESVGGICAVAGNIEGNVVGQDPKLGPLADNGGPTLTHPLLVGSPAFEAGSFDCPPPETDQRGVSRPQFVRCDIGATESEDILGIVSVTVDETATLLGTGRVTTTGTVYCGPVGDTVRVFVQVNQDSTGASSRVGSITDTCTGEPDEPWTVTPRKKSGSPAFSTGPAEVCFEVRTKEGSTLIDRAAGCEPVTLFSA